MFFSVIVPVYKVEEYLPACVDSVLAQTFSDFELILVDDGSPDRCGQICDAYREKDSRVKVVHKANGGLTSARRAGVQVATGDYVLNLDSDDMIEKDTLESAHQIIEQTDCQIVSFSYRWVNNGKTVNITHDGLEEGLYNEKEIQTHIYPRILMGENMDHVSYYLAGKVVKRDLLTPHQLSVSEHISLGEDMCCMIPCYLQANSVYISKKITYLYTVRNNSLSKEFNTKQIRLVDNVIHELRQKDTKKVADFEQQMYRYSCFMCFAILAAAAEGGYFKSINPIVENINNTVNGEYIRLASFRNISLKSRISISLMKKNRYRTAFYFLNLCKKFKKILKKG